MELTPGAKLGEALMQPPLIRGDLKFSGVVFGDSALEVGSEAAKAAHAFFGHYDFRLDISAEAQSDGGYVATFWAEHA